MKLLTSPFYYFCFRIFRLPAALPAHKLFIMLPTGPNCQSQNQELVGKMWVCHELRCLHSCHDLDNTITAITIPHNRFSYTQKKAKPWLWSLKLDKTASHFFFSMSVFLIFCFCCFETDPGGLVRIMYAAAFLTIASPSCWLQEAQPEGKH